MSAFDSSLATGSNSANVLLGSGRLLYTAVNTTTGAPAASGWRDLGNATDFSLSFSTDTIDRQNFRGCEVLTDLQLNNGTTVGFNLVLDELSAENAAYLTTGVTGSATVPLNTNVSATTLVANPIQYAEYELTTSAGSRYIQLDDASNLTINNGTSDLVLNTDYSVDLTHGTIKILTNTNAANTLTWAWDGSGSTDVTVTKTEGFTGNSFQGMFMFKGINRNGCTPFQLQLFNIIGRPDGDLPLLGGTKSEIRMSGAVASSALAKSYYGSNSEFFQLWGDMTDTAA